MIEELITRYLAGPAELRAAIEGMSPEELNATPIPGQWSTRQLVCHLADFEPVYMNRMKRVIAEDNPTFFGGFHEQFAQRLAYDSRDIEQELALIELSRQHMGAILKTLDLEDFQRTGVHSEDGPMTLETLLERITGHIPHHGKFIAEKRTALAG